MNEPTQSASIAALAAARAKAKIPTIPKQSINPHFRSRFADLATMIGVCEAPLAAQGLAVIQTTEPNEHGVCVVTTLAHSSGEWITGRLFLPVVKSDPQGYGSAITYARRYAYAAILCVAAEDDDDGEAASRPAAPAPAPKPLAARGPKDVRSYTERMNAATSLAELTQIGADLHDDPSAADDRARHREHYLATKKRLEAKRAPAPRERQPGEEG